MVLAFNVEQLGTSWMVPIAVRSARIKKVLGVWSHMLRRLFHVLLLADDLIAAMSAHACATQLISLSMALTVARYTTRFAEPSTTI